MKISYNWLKDYVQIKLKPPALAEKLTMAGLEVVSWEEKMGDWIFEIEITSNRPDWLSAIGIAREVAAITGAKLKLPKLSSIGYRLSSIDDFEISIQDKKSCPFYSASLIKDVKVTSSPDWLKQKLEAIGLRPVNNIVDITNFCLMETGQPLHAFDSDKISANTIIVRRAKQGETIVTIDGMERKLNPGILVIADAKKPIAIAGIMGGIETEVTEKTKNILLESAYFAPTLIRRASRILGISSESSYRFERNADIENVLPSAKRAVNLIQDLAKGKLISICAQPQKPPKPNPRKISLCVDSVENLLGIKITPQKIKSILSSLQFKLTAKKNSFIVRAPSFRQDIQEEADLIEEIARIFGFEKVPQTLAPVKIFSVKKDSQALLKDFSRQFFISSGFNEIISLNLISRGALLKTNLNYQNLAAIENPLSKEQEILAPSLIPGLLNAVKNNLNHNLRDLKLFEVGKNYLADKEFASLAAVICGEKYANWLRASLEKSSFFDLKGAIAAFLERMGISGFEFEIAASAAFKNCASIKIKDEEIGILGEISDEVLLNWEIKQKGIFLSEINLEKVSQFFKLEKKFTALASFPSVKRDISLVIKDEIPSDAVFKTARQSAGDLLRDLRLVELYSGGQVPAGFKGMTISLEYQSKQRTLTDSEVNLIHDKLCMAFKEKLQAKIR